MYNNLRYVIVIGLLIIAVYFYKYIPSNKSSSFQKYPNNMVLIPGGKYLMGSDKLEAYTDEKPVHEVIVDSFLMDKYEITNHQFLQFVNATGYITTAEKKIDWNDIASQLPPNTPKPSDSLLQPGSLVFKAGKYPIPLHDESKWWEWKIGASWKHPFGGNSSIKKLWTILLFTFLGMMHLHMLNGQEKDFQQKLSGNGQQEGKKRMQSTPGVMSLLIKNR